MGTIRNMAIQSRDPLVMVPGGAPMPWPPEDERFTDAASRALGFALDEAARLNHNHVGAAHIFVGVVREPEGIAARALAALGVTLARARGALESVGGRGEPIAASDITLGPRGKRVMEFAIHESRRLHHGSAGTEHLLLAAARERDGFVSRVVELLGLDEETLTARTLAELEIPQSYRVAEDASSRRGPYHSFDEASKQTLLFAEEEAAMQGHGWVSGQDLVLGLARIAQLGASDPVRRVFAEFDLTVEKLRDAVPKPPTPQQPQPSADEMKFTASTKLIIEHAIHQAGSGGTIHPEHILLAIGTSQDPIAEYVLAQFGATTDRVRTVLERMRG